MKKVFKRVVSTALAVSMLFTSAVTRTVLAADFTAAGGWYETLFAELNVDESKVTAVSYSGTGASGSLTGQDLSYLVRANGSGKTRIDIPGVPAGTYTLKVTAGGTEYTKSGITVYESDRSGYAHKDAGSTGIGAYNNDGTLKSNALVIYVTEENKNSVKIENCSAITNSPVGIGNILNYKSSDSNGTTGGGKDDVLKNLANANIPLVVRFIGAVYAGDENTRGSVPANGNINGLTGYDSKENGGTPGDNGMVARMYNAQNVTIEGIGTDAAIDGWGFQVLSGTERPSQSLEFRNLTFRMTPEDAIGFEGTLPESSSLQTKEWMDQNGSPIKYCWAHNCTFEHGYCKNPAESDKAEGDGSLDFKRGYGFTQDYNHYIENHKTNLIGSSSKSVQYDVTYHHNYYEKVWSRQPLIRQANAHIYNSYFQNGDGTSYIISPRALSYTLSEANFYDGCKNPVDSPKEGGGYVKSYKDTFSGCFGNNYATIVDDRTQAISGNNHTYKNDFDASTLPYSYNVTSAVQAKTDCIAKAGVMKPASQINMTPSLISNLSEYPSGCISLPYSLDLSATYQAGKTVVDNAILNAASKSSGGTVKIRANGLIFTINQRATVSFTSGSSSAYGMELLDEYGDVKAKIEKSGSKSVVVDPGTYVLQSGNTAKDAYLEAFNVKAVSGAPVVELTTQPTTQAPVSPTEATTKKTETPTETTTQAQDINSEVPGDGYIWNGSTGENTDNFFYVGANDYLDHSVEYKGATLTNAIKMEQITDIHFDAISDGTLYIYTYSTKGADATIKINDATESVSDDGINEFVIGSDQTIYITKGTTSTYIYFMQFVPKQAGEVTEATTEATTETTTLAPVTQTTTQKAEEQTTEATTAAPTGGVKIYGAEVDVNVGQKAVVSVRAEDKDNNNIGGYVVALSYDSALTFGDVENKSSNGQIVDFDKDNAAAVAYVGSVAPNSDLFTVSFTATKSGKFPIKIIVQEVIDTNANALNAETAKDAAVNAAAEISANGSGDVYKDGVIDEKDAAYLMKYIAGVTITDSKFDISEGNCDGIGSEPDMLDVVWILNNMTTGGGQETPASYINDKGVIAGTYDNKAIYEMAKDATNDYVIGDSAYSLKEGELKVRSGKGIYFTPGITGTLTITWTNKIPAVSLNGTAVEGSTTGSLTSYAVTAGSKYLIEGSTTSNTTISLIELK